MTGLVSILGLGLFLGMRHATDPDHVIAVTTLVAGQRSTRSAALIGMIWGFGHTLTILLVGAGIILLGWVIPARLGLSLEFAVGVMLVLLGMSSLRPGLVHPHSPGSGSHLHALEPARLGWLDRRLEGLGAYQLLRPLIVGIVHGLAGSAAVALLVLTTIRAPSWAMLYLLVFGAGTIAGMMLITMMVAAPFSTLGRRSFRFNHGLRIATGLLSVGFGLFLAWKIGVVQGLFGAAPLWTPR